MFINHATIAIIFRLINFIALLGFFFFLFKKYILPNVQELIAQKNAEHEALYAQQTFLEQQQCNLDSILKQELILCQDFRLKIDEWKRVATLAYDQQTEEHNNYIIKYSTNMTHKAVLQEHKRAQQIITHTIITDLEQSLSLHFKNPEHNSDYLDAIIHFMDHNKS